MSTSPSSVASASGPQSNKVSAVLEVVKLILFDYDGTLVKDGTNPIINFLQQYSQVRNQTIQLLRDHPETLAGIMSGRTLDEVKAVSDFFLTDVDQKYYSYLAAENGSVIEVPCSSEEMVRKLQGYAEQQGLRFTHNQDDSSVTLLTAKYDRHQLFEKCISTVIADNQVNLDGVVWAHSEIPEAELEGEQAKLLAKLSGNADLEFVRTIVKRQSGIILKFPEEEQDKKEVARFLDLLEGKCKELGVRFHSTTDETSVGDIVNVDLAQSDKGRAVEHLTNIFQMLAGDKKAVVPAPIGNAGNDLPAFGVALEQGGQAFLVDSPQIKHFTEEQIETVGRLRDAGMKHVMPSRQQANPAILALVAALA